MRQDTIKSRAAETVLIGAAALIVLLSALGSYAGLARAAPEAGTMPAALTRLVETI